jgi:16S rRNA (guanine966-N2)-methyltransferase
VRIVGGALRGRAIVAPDGAATRPTSDRVREAIFNILAHGIDPFEINGVHVLDLFAGSGALGIEAISRGAASVLFVEHDAAARAAIRDNIEALGLTGVTRIFRRDATDLGPAGRERAFGLVFADPPYGKALAPKALTAAASGGWLASGAVVVIEERKRETVALPAGFTLIDMRTWGDTQAVFARYAGGSP